MSKQVNILSFKFSCLLYQKTGLAARTLKNGGQKKQDLDTLTVKDISSVKQGGCQTTYPSHVLGSYFCERCKWG